MSLGGKAIKPIKIDESANLRIIKRDVQNPAEMIHFMILFIIHTVWPMIWSLQDVICLIL